MAPPSGRTSSRAADRATRPKGSLLPHETGMRLLRQPRPSEPTVFVKVACARSRSCGSPASAHHEPNVPIQTHFTYMCPADSNLWASPATDGSICSCQRSGFEYT